MGYGIVLHLRHDGLGEVDDATLGRDLVSVTGNDRYPSGTLAPTTAGLWSRAGAWHSNARTVLVADADGIRPVEGEPDGGGAWSPVLTVGQLAERERAVMHDPGLLTRAGGNLWAAVLGPDPLPRAAASVWWVYADCLDALAVEDPAGLGASVRAAAVARFDGQVAVGSYMNALCCAGRVGAGPVTVVWEGNRLHAL